MKGSKQVVDDSLVKVKFVTADYMVPKVLKFIETHNPNDKNKSELPLLAT